MVDSAEEFSSQKQKVHENYGFDLYPERRSKKKKFANDKDFAFSNKNRHYRDCEKKLIRCMKENPLVKLLLGALRNAGCPVNVRRHIVCEKCDSAVTGGYDQEFNQIVICDNVKTGILKKPDATLVHELIHMFDYCTRKVDFSNLEHLACTEIRAANLSHCSFVSSVLLSQSSLFSIKKTHQNCVKLKAAQSMAVSRNMDFEAAMNVILKVFDKCYNDLEPIGRRVRRNSMEHFMAYNEAVHLGFCKS